MAEIEKYHDGETWRIKSLTRSLVGEKPICVLCGDEATGYWDSDTREFGGEAKIVGICKGCAVNRLPLLIADAIAGNKLGPSIHAHNFKGNLETVIGTFWRGVAFAVSRRIGYDHTKDDGRDNGEYSDKELDAQDGAPT